MSCPDCTRAATEEWHGFSAGCKQCEARGIARIFLRKGERGRRMRLACDQFNLKPDDVHRAWRVDAMNTERPAP